MIASVFVLHRLIIWLNAFPKRLMILTQYLMCCIYLSRSTTHEQRQPLLRVPDTESDLLTYLIIKGCMDLGCLSVFRG